MCLVIDVNTLSKVFDRGSIGHAEYKPVLDWITEGKGKLVCGGSKYWEELKKITKYLKIINRLNSARKVVKVCDTRVDNLMNKLIALCNDKDFDDPHIVALVIVSKVKVICSEDSRAYPYLTNKQWYPEGQSVPKIYRNTALKKASTILSDKNIAEICLPCEKLKKNIAKNLIT